MSERACPACEKPFRKGRIVKLANASSLRPAIVCVSCAEGGITLVYAVRAGIWKVCCKSKATCCDGCAVGFKSLISKARRKS